MTAPRVAIGDKLLFERNGGSGRRLVGVLGDATALSSIVLLDPLPGTGENFDLVFTFSFSFPFSSDLISFHCHI
jgi:hypothetical protein